MFRVWGFHDANIWLCAVFFVILEILNIFGKRFFWSLYLKFRHIQNNQSIGTRIRSYFKFNHWLIKTLRITWNSFRENIIMGVQNVEMFFQKNNYLSNNTKKGIDHFVKFRNIAYANCSTHNRRSISTFHSFFIALIINIIPREDVHNVISKLLSDSSSIAVNLTKREGI